MTKAKKPFGETKFGAFINKAAAEVKEHAPQVAGTLLTVATSGNPAGAIIGEVKGLLTGQGKDDLVSELTQNESEFMGELEYQLELHKLDHADRGQARAMYPESKDMADRIGQRVFNWNLPAVGILIAALILCAVHLEGGLLATVASIIGAVIRDLLSERQIVINFLFGSSLGSKKKDEKMAETIAKTQKP